MSKIHETLLMDYAAGTLDTAHNILVASYLTLSPEARRTVAACETLGAALLEHGCDCAEMSATCLDAVMAKIDCLEQNCAEDKECIESCVSGCAALPQPLARAMPADKPVKWHERDGLQWTELVFSDGSSLTRLIRGRPGSVVKQQQSALALVLDGGFEHASMRYARGDLLVIEETATACPQSGCVILSVMARPAGFFARVFGR